MNSPGFSNFFNFLVFSTFLIKNVDLKCGLISDRIFILKICVQNGILNWLYRWVADEQCHWDRKKHEQPVLDHLVALADLTLVMI